jgi:hypothetical protein
MKKHSLLLITILLLLFPMGANATIYDLNQTNFTIGGATPYATVEVTDSSNIVTFTIALENFLLTDDLAGPQSIIGEFGFNSDAALTLANFGGLPSSWTVLSTDAQMDGESLIM